MSIMYITRLNTRQSSRRLELENVMDQPTDLPANLHSKAQSYVSATKKGVGGGDAIWHSLD